jgi:hypothetical protein
MMVWGPLASKNVYYNADRFDISLGVQITMFWANGLDFSFRFLVPVCFVYVGTTLTTWSRNPKCVAVGGASDPCGRGR